MEISPRFGPVPFICRMMQGRMRIVTSRKTHAPIRPLDVQTQTVAMEQDRIWDLSVLVFVLFLALVFGMDRWVGVQMGDNRAPSSVMMKKSTAADMILDMGCIDEAVSVPRLIRTHEHHKSVKVRGRFCGEVLPARRYQSHDKTGRDPAVSVTLEESKIVAPVFVLNRDRVFVSEALQLAVGKNTVGVSWRDFSGNIRRSTAPIDDSVGQPKGDDGNLEFRASP